MDIYFIVRVKIQYYGINFVAQIGPSLAFGNLFSWFLCLFDTLPSWFFSPQTSLLLVQHYALDSFYIFSVAALEIAISPRMPGFFY